MDELFSRDRSGPLLPWPKVCEDCDAHGPDHMTCPWPCTAFRQLEAIKKLLDEILEAEG